MDEAIKSMELSLDAIGAALRESILGNNKAARGYMDLAATHAKAALLRSQQIQRGALPAPVELWSEDALNRLMADVMCGDGGCVRDGLQDEGMSPTEAAECGVKPDAPVGGMEVAA